MIRLGTHDLDVPESTRLAYDQLLTTATRVRLSDVQTGDDKLQFHTRTTGGRQTMSVSDVQRGLKDIGFFPGGTVDGICGYRTRSAIRLFQEYVRTVEGLGGLPDGVFGQNTEGHLRRWLDDRPVNEWAAIAEDWRSGTLAGTEYDRWLALGRKAQDRHAAHPSRMLTMVRDFTATSDTHPVGDWDFGPERIHLFGIRRDQFSGKFDDIFVFLLKGLVFKFQGSTEPGSSSHEDGRPFLVPGQHDYHFGWHQRRYLALRPKSLNGGVLIVRSKNDSVLDDSDLDRGLSTNPTINIHWAGKGLTFDVNSWSEGCQVINGSYYADHRGQVIDCSSFVATNNGTISSTRTRGAYNVLVDLATALSGDLDDTTVLYTLLTEDDLELDPALKADLDRARAAVVERMT